MVAWVFGPVTAIFNPDGPIDFGRYDLYVVLSGIAVHVLDAAVVAPYLYSIWIECVTTFVSDEEAEDTPTPHGWWCRVHGLVFPSEVGTPMSGRNLYRAFKIRVKRASLPQTLRFHDLRHTCATLLLRQGINPKFVQELLGHADISLTLNTYSHVLPDMGDAAADGMDAALG
jgi:integrase